MAPKKGSQPDSDQQVQTPANNQQALTPKTALPNTLARRLQVLREAKNMSVERLAEKAILPRQVIDDIEAGLETFLAPAIRQKLARALLVRISVLKEVEIQPDLEAIAPTMAYGETAEDLLEAMVEEPDRTYFCPLCGEKLQLRMFDRRDIQNNPMIALKINCSRCLFRLEKN